MRAASPFDTLQSNKYASVESFRKNGQGVSTPVWFAADPVDASPKTLYIYSTADSGKAKRIRRDSRVRIAPCDMRGNLQGDWIEARGEIVAGEEARRAMRLLDEKYKPWRQILDFFSRFSRRGRVVFAIRLV